MRSRIAIIKGLFGAAVLLAVGIGLITLASIIKERILEVEVSPVNLRYPFTRNIIDPRSPHDPWAKAIGDLDGDSIQDVIVAGSRGPLVWYSHPSWLKVPITGADAYYTESGMAVGDIDGDGDLDITFGSVWFENPRPHAAPMSIWPPHPTGAKTNNHNVEVADLDKDKRPDIVMRGQSDSLITVLKQELSGSWSLRNIDPGVGLNGLALADVDGDLHTDIIVGGVWLKNPNGDILGGSWEKHEFGSWDPYAAIATGDINGDGRLDVVLAVSEKAGKVSWYENPPNPTDLWLEHVIDLGPVDSAHAITVLDMDKDGFQDVVTAEFRGDGRILIYHNKEHGSSWTRQVLGKPALHNITAGDLDNDGDVDLVGTVTFGEGNVEIWENHLTTLGLPNSGQRKVLVFWKTDVAFHVSIPEAIRAIKEMAVENNFIVEDTADAGMFMDQVLAQYKAVIFLSTQGAIFNAAQRAAFERYIREGGGFVGVHSAADTEHNWPWFGGLVGAYYGGSHSDNVRAKIRIEDGTHPSTKGLPNPWIRIDEWYNFLPNPRTKGVTVLLSVDETTYQGGGMGTDHPIAWYHEYDGGRAWYTAGGATVESWKDSHFRNHVSGGIRYAAGF